ncbi:unnamed protein product [Ixodes pacificus]
MRSPILHQPEPLRSLDTENHVRRRRASVASLRPVRGRFGRRTRLPIGELVHGRALRRDSDGWEREHFSDYFSDEGGTLMHGIKFLHHCFSLPRCSCCKNRQS